jgi:hypothetical protein
MKPQLAEHPPTIPMKNKTNSNRRSVESFRPVSYWEDADPLAAILRNVKGQMRRQIIRDHWNADTLENLDPAFLADETDPKLRRMLERLHPKFMGGEYLPRFLPTEVEIADISLQSVTSDTISIRARQVPGDTRIYYRIVDEYRTQFECEPEWSDEPLTHGELLDLIGRESGLGLCYNEENLPYHRDVVSLRHFTTVSSNFYPDLFDHYDKIHEQWVKEMLAHAAAEGA